nr:uncharacterized protein LOC107451555 [Parasteatoda tepidariorum]
MWSHLGRALSSLLLICFILSSTAQDEIETPPFPSIQNYTFYYTDVQFTDIELQVSAFASEYFDSTGGPRGRVNVISLGEKSTTIYNKDTDQIFEINSTNCQVWDTDESIRDYEPIFTGWLNKEPLVIGPSAILWTADADRDKIEYMGETIIRDINCEAWRYNLTNEMNQLVYTMHFAAKKWTTPYQMDGDLRVPIRVEVSGLASEKKDEWFPVNQLTDFAFFRPDFPNFRVFQPPQGIGCRLKKETRKMPTMPDIFRYSAEVVDLIQSSKEEITDIEYQQVWYDTRAKLARLDKYTRMRSVSEFYDFNTGVTYSIVDRRTCSINPLRYAFFEGYDGKMIGHLKDPDEVLDLDGSFYFLGKVRMSLLSSIENCLQYKADYTTTGVYVTGLMLDRPPALKQFWLEREGDVTTTDPKLKVAPAADTAEKCAFACVEEGMFCYGFFWCNQACFLKFKDILEPDDGGDSFDFGGTCQEWLRAERDSNNKEAYLKDALQSLEKTVLDNLVNVSVPLDDNMRSFITVPVSDIVIGDGPYTGISGQDKPYNLAISFAKMDPGDESTEVLSYIDNLNDCYLACKNTEDVACSSFSYCPDSDNKQCSLSSVLVVDRKNNPDDTVDDKNCYVYSMKYLDYYTAYPGRLSLIPGADVFEKVKTVEECAKKCRTAKDITCRGFEYCQSMKTCVLHSKHVLDLNPGEVITNKKSTCIHYAAKYSADYFDLGLVLVDDILDERSEISLEDCAKACSEEFKDKCKSFNYCPASGPYMTDSACSLSAMTLKTPRVPTTKNAPCHHFEKRNQVDDWAKAGKKSLVTAGYTSSQFTWLVVGMLALGFALGAIGFVVYSYFRSKGSESGMTVRFMKQGNL